MNLIISIYISAYEFLNEQNVNKTNANLLTQAPVIWTLSIV